MTMTVQADRITVSFKAVEALKAVSLAVAPGEQVALLGHNGAGKTTLFRIILGFLRPASGTISISGYAANSYAVRRIVSYLPESFAFPKMLTGREIVRFYADLKGAPRGDIDDVLRKVDLIDAADRRVDTYSKGMRQRLGLAQALLGSPGLLLLDEPTSGLDPISRQHFYELTKEVAARGGSVLLSSHGLSELEAKTDRVAILRKGQLVANGPLVSLQREANLPIRIRVRVSEGAVDHVHNRLGGTRINGESLELLSGVGDKMSMLAQISDLGARVEDIDVAPPTLDEVYRYFSRSADDSEARE